ncbi:aminopeptidase N [Rhizobium sp. L1K21]|uniref:aminopeptidase N n=1 Tax=Rhizobium sp. L1K21 TaxID=2954933 RepID=UPI0020932A74|nr:aminopeptidase N [Rhizobium sp. L1K21]MCO6186665.1 aminopeptidase N [Rhizobium sp. L1K21]
MRTDTGKAVHLEDYKETDFVLERVDLTFELDPKETKLTARSLYHRREGAGADAPLVLDGDELNMTSLLLDGVEMPREHYEENGRQLIISNLPAEIAFEITVETLLSPSTNTELMGLYRSNGVYCTQCEAEGFRRMTYAYDRPDSLGVYTTHIIADKTSCPIMLSNGNCLGGAPYGGDKHFVSWFDPHPKPSYLFALVAGDLGVVEDTFTTMTGREVTLKIYVEHGKEPRAAYAMDALKRSMKWDEEVFGREYDLDIFMIVAVSDFNMGAMENKGLNIFNDKYVLADPETATDVDYANIEAIIAHEYFHNWTGNRITCRDWFQLCLKEGLTVFRDHEFSADQRSRAVKRIAEVRRLKADQFPEDGGPLAHPVRPTTYKEINNFYTATVYEKGAEVTRMISVILGRKAFKAGMDLYFERHDGQAVTIEDYIKCFEDASGADLTQFALWYHQAGTPLISVSTDYDAGKGVFTLSLEQMIPATPGQPNKVPMHIPLSFALLLPDGSKAEPESIDGGDVSKGVIHLRERKQVLTFTGLPTRPALSLNRGFSAPVNIQFDQNPADLALIANHDDDLFSRWYAVTELALPELIMATASIRANGAADFSDTLVDTLVSVAGDEKLEPAFRSQVLALPSESDIAREIARDTDPDAIHAARNALLKAVALKGATVFAQLFDRMKTPDAFSPDAESAGKRALRNAALFYLAHAEDSPARAFSAFDTATNMTDLSQALTVLAHEFPDSDETKEALRAFLARYSDNALVLDKWFSVQASAPGHGTLERVKALMTHPQFNAENPNRVRALAGTFAFANPTGFARPDGEGFTFLAEQVLAIDKRNPQLAARLLTALRSWHSLEQGRASHARAALLSVEQNDSLSIDVRDIVERMLAA